MFLGVPEAGSFHTVPLSHPNITYDIVQYLHPAECHDTDHKLSSGLICCSFSNWWKHQGHVTTSGGGQSRLGSPKLKLWRRRWQLVFYLLSDRSYQISSMLETVSWKNYERIPSVAIAFSHKNLTGVLILFVLSDLETNVYNLLFHDSFSTRLTWFNVHCCTHRTRKSTILWVQRCAFLAWGSLEE